MASPEPINCSQVDGIVLALLESGNQFIQWSWGWDLLEGSNSYETSRFEFAYGESGQRMTFPPEHRCWVEK